MSLLNRFLGALVRGLKKKNVLEIYAGEARKVEGPESCEGTQVLIKSAINQVKVTLRITFAESSAENFAKKLAVKKAGTKATEAELLHEFAKEVGQGVAEKLAEKKKLILSFAEPQVSQDGDLGNEELARGEIMVIPFRADIGQFLVQVGMVEI